ncbi:hypothetical protein AB0C90_24655 [Streptomyces sp. NPDC048550]|uniref:hypothetical protein n=1 Tax=unclassified Streptomyces TaxID=2593676 RepID=UPI003445FCAE
MSDRSRVSLDRLLFSLDCSPKSARAAALAPLVLGQDRVLLAEVGRIAPVSP